VEAAAVVAQLDEMAGQVPVDAPWNAASASDWDGQTLQAWLESHSSYSLNSRFRRLVSVATRPIFGAEASELSLLFTLFYIAASGDEKHPGTFEQFQHRWRRPDVALPRRLAAARTEDGSKARRSGRAPLPRARHPPSP
jgi:hypothetical protein